MRFALSDDQEELRSLARRFFDAEFPIERVRRVMESTPGQDTSSWAQLARVGFTGLAIGEEYGGAGASAVEVAVLLREAGRALIPAPLLPTLVAAAALSAAADDSAEEWLPRIATGRAVASLAGADGHPSTDIADTATAAQPEGRGWVLHGVAEHVIAGAVADLFLVTATTDTDVGLFAVPADAPGVSRTAVAALDPTRSLAEVRLDHAPATRLPLDRTAIETVLQTAAVWLASEQVGGAERCLETSVEYARNRVQFGRPIGSFQAIKHLLADLLLEVEAARAAADYAAWTAAASPAELPMAASLAKAVCSDTYVQAAAVTIQVHGGMGFTWEHDAHLHLKRAMSGKQLLGSPDLHRERLADMALAGVEGGASGPAAPAGAGVDRRVGARDEET